VALSATLPAHRSGPGGKRPSVWRYHAAALELYRFRWQIELAFKRLKSLLSLDQLPAFDEQLVRTIIYAKLLAALILSDYRDSYLNFFPWGYFPLNVWHSDPQRCQRHLFDTPRRRVKQAAQNPILQPISA